jgi:polyhydroxybutyrate depolymerase
MSERSRNRHLAWGVATSLAALLAGGPAAPQAPFRLSLCTEAPVHLQGPPGARQSRGCVATFVQQLDTNQVTRRYLVYAPEHLPDRPLPVVLVFPGRSASAESVAFYDTRTRFETLADRDGFVVVYGNGLPDPDPSHAAPKGGFLQGCLLPHDGEGIDVIYVRRILDQLQKELPIDRNRVYATGLSAGGGLAFELALEAPDVVAAIAPVAGMPYQPSGHWLHGCHPRPGHEHVSIAMVAATDDPMIAYAPGPSRDYPTARYPGMEQTRDAWLAALGLSGPPEVDHIPDRITGDSYQPDTGRTTSTIERQRYRPAPDGHELWFYKAVGMGHTWPNPTPTWQGLWSRFGKTNQDLDFADEAWAFFRRHAKR